MRIRHIAGSDEEVASCPVVVPRERAATKDWQGNFGNDHPIRLEIGTGKGQFIIEMAKQNPDANFIGIDLFTDVLCRAVRKWTRDPAAPDNMRLVIWDAATIEEMFRPGQVDRIYLNFSDPWPKPRHAKRRLTSPSFLYKFSEALTEGGKLEFKTDNADLFTYSLEQFDLSPCFEIEAFTRDLHADEEMNQGNIMTEYEEKFSERGTAICKLIAVKK